MNEIADKAKNQVQEMLQNNSWLEKLQNSSWLDTALHRGRKSIPHIARFLLVSTFIDDGIRMWSEWDSQRNYVENTWSCGWYVATLFVVFNLVGQLVSSALVLSRRQVTVACCILLAVTIVQTVFYRVLWNFNFLMRNLSIIGGVVLLLADVKTEGRQLFAGLPTADDKSLVRKPYVLLSGRILLMLMFLTILRLEATMMWIILDCIGLALAAMIAIGYKTTQAAGILAAWLTILNFYANSWWTLADDDHAAQREFLKYYFFQTLSMTGGLLLIVAFGPGGLSFDKRNKQL